MKLKIMNHIRYHVLLVMLVNIVASEITVTFCEKKNSEKCLNKIIKRSIEEPITSIIDNDSFEKIYSGYKPIDKAVHITQIYSIQCDDSDLVLNINKASMSNANKTKCLVDEPIESTESCTDSIQTKILVSNLCNGENKCKISMDDENFSKLCECSAHKYLSISYTCIQPNKVLRKRAATQFNLKKHHGSGYGGVKEYRGKSDLDAVKTLRKSNRYTYKSRNSNKYGNRYGDRESADSQYENRYGDRRYDDKYDDSQYEDRYIGRRNPGRYDDYDRYYYDEYDPYYDDYDDYYDYYDYYYPYYPYYDYYGYYGLYGK